VVSLLISSTSSPAISLIVEGFIILLLLVELLNFTTLAKVAVLLLQMLPKI
jgi:hypothetical protein